jgi:hypothetical protein
MYVKVNDVKDDLSQIGFDIESIQQMVAGLVSLSILLNLFVKCFQNYYISYIWFLLSSGRKDWVAWE